MEIKILSDDYLKSNNLFQDFVDNRINENAISNEFVELRKIEYFPVYMAKIKNKKSWQICI